MTTSRGDSHSLLFGYLLWLFGFTGSHRFYYGKTKTGILWFCTGGFFLVGWLIDLFLIPGMDREADERYREGPASFAVGWLLLTFLGYLGLHRFYLGRWKSGLLYLLTGGLFAIGWLWDFIHLNEMISESNTRVT